MGELHERLKDRRDSSRSVATAKAVTDAMFPLDLGMKRY